ncbi:MAG TPA: UDP-N-acetylmuramoyl-tripeptide--D-alanyl-D-alanine ligase [bacterium]|nr:UDP-N-acetylmuramoyl-tripeptide--D-alanyl-D-alanine ligase [bacterium]
MKLSIADVANWTGGHLLKGEAAGTVTAISTDSRKTQSGEAFLALRGENFDGHQFATVAARAGAGLVILEENHPTVASAMNEFPAVIVVRDTLVAYGEIAKGYRKQFSLRVLALTGSVGKTSTRGFIASVLRQKFRVLESEKNFNNLIGVPQTLLNLKDEHERAVLELGADRPGEIPRLTEMCRPRIGVLTGVFPCHLERFGSLDVIVEEKGMLLSGLQGDGTTGLIGSDSYGLDRLKSLCRGCTLTYGAAEGDFHASDIVLRNDGTTDFSAVSKERKVAVHLRVLGEHQIKNAVAAFAVGCLENFPDEIIKQGLESYNGAWGRLERIDLPSGATLLKDVYNANPNSTRAALNLLGSLPARKRIAVLGDMMELGDDSESFHREMGAMVAQSELDMLLTVGERSQAIAEQAKADGFRGTVQQCSSNGAVSDLLKTEIRKGDVVLLKASRAMKFEEISEHLEKTPQGESCKEGSNA